ALALHQQQRIAKVARKDRADLSAKIEAGIELLSQCADERFNLATLPFRQLAVAQPATCRASHSGNCHDGCQEARIETEFSVGPNVLGTVRKGEQAGVAHAPCIESIAGFADEALADATVPDVGPDGDRPEEAHAPPAGREVRSDELPIVLGRERFDVLGAEAAFGIVEVAPEFLRI